MKYLMNIFNSSNSTKRKIHCIIDDMKEIVSTVCSEKFWINWYGAYEIDPKHLVVWICIETDATKTHLELNSELATALRNTLTKHNYPEQARESVCIGFESQETVDRESNGNWYDHFK